MTAPRCAVHVRSVPFACSCISARVQEIRRRLEPAQWQTAWDNFAVAAEILGVLDMKSSMLHKRHMQVLTENAVKEGRKPLFSVLYDELLRCVCVCVCVSPCFYFPRVFPCMW